jgi:hypothetical protein
MFSDERKADVLDGFLFFQDPLLPCRAPVGHAPEYDARDLQTGVAEAN